MGKRNNKNRCKYTLKGNTEGQGGALYTNVFIMYERRVLQMINWAIKTFDTPIEGIRFNVINGVPQSSNPLKRDYKKLRTDILKTLLKEYYEKDLISFTESQMLEIQLESTDRDDWYMAFLCIKSLKKRKVQR